MPVGWVIPDDAKIDSGQECRYGGSTGRHNTLAIAL
jgi:hypothetical protein